MLIERFTSIPITRMATRPAGIQVVYELVAAHIEERITAETALDFLSQSLVIGDKGFLGQAWQAQTLQQTANTIVTPKRKNQKARHRPGYQAVLNARRERIEGVFHELQNTGRNLERLLAKTVIGLTTRLIAKVTTHLFKHILRLHCHIDIQTLQCASNFTSDVSYINACELQFIRPSRM